MNIHGLVACLHIDFRLTLAQSYSVTKHFREKRFSRQSEIANSIESSHTLPLYLTQAGFVSGPPMNVFAVPFLESSRSSSKEKNV